MSMDYNGLKGEYPVYDFEAFIPSSECAFPDNRIMKFLTVGPFVLHTDGSFEAEHMYERNKILEEDYLLSDGGEACAKPVLDGRVRNKYYGDEYLYWKNGRIKWNCLRFDDEEIACDPALYVTQQRNAVYYAAFYVRCSGEKKAIICYENSGSALFVNGEQIDFKPFGRVKGLWGLGYQCSVTFNDGLNLVMFKIRPGYIADSMDISISNCSVFPVILSNEDFSLTTPTITFAYTGEKGNENQVFPVFIEAHKDTEEKEIDYSIGTLRVPEMKKGQILPLRFEIPAKENTTVKTFVTLGNEKAEYFFPTAVYDGFEGTEHIFSDFHFDTTYHQEQRTYALGAFHITKSLIERLISNPDFKATLSEIDYLHPYYSLYPQHREVLKSCFSSGRAEADCFYNQPNDLTSSGEAFVRNLIYGQLYHRDVLGRISTTYQPGDVFGHFSQITQVCKKGGCDYIKWGKMMLGVDSLFRHVSPDGTSLLHDKNMNRSTAKRLGVKGCDASSGYLSHIEAFPRECDTSWMKNTVSGAEFAVFSQLGKIVNESVNELKKKGEDKEILYSSRDITQHHSGVILTRTDFKQANRLCENLLVTAEKFASVAFMYGMKYPDKAIDKAVRQLLCAQHHDSITGTNNEISFVDLMIEYRESAEILTDIIERSCRFIASGIKTGEGSEYIYVFNPLTWERGGKCYFNIPEGLQNEDAFILTDVKGRTYPALRQGNFGWFIASRLPSMGYSVFKIEKGSKEEIIRGNDTVIENNRFTLRVDKEKGGTIVSLYDKKEKREIIDKSAPAPANTVYVMKEIHDRMETQHELYTTGHKLLSSDYEADITSEKSALYQKIISKVKLDTIGVLISEITLYKNSDTVDFRTSVEDYQAEDDLFSVTFPVDIKGGQVIFDDRFSPHVSTRSKKYMSFQTHQYASFSGCRVLPTNQWFGIGPTVTAVINNEGSFNFGMTAIIREENDAVRDFSDRILFALTKKAVPVTLYPDREQHGGMKIIHFNEDIYSTDTRIVVSLYGDNNVYKEKLLSPLKTKEKEKLEKALEKYGFIYLYLRDGDNEYKKETDVLLLIGKDRLSLEKAVSELEDMLKNGSKLYLDRVISTVKPEFSDDYGCVLINNGTPASSVEGRGTLNMMLFHTASFYGNMGKVTGGKEMVPEQKSHIFTYSLYPHKNSYREASVYKKAFEFNDSLFAISDVKEKRNEVLPMEKAFLKSPDGFSITAFKAKGYPYANFTRAEKDCFSRGFTVRGFENQGISKNVTLKTGFSVFGAQKTDLLDENSVPLKAGNDSVSFISSPHEIVTVQLKAPSTEKIADNEEVIIEKEKAQKVYIRSWEHDMGSMPMGNLTFMCSIERLPLTNNEKETLYINAVNNSSYEDINSVINIECSENIFCDTESIDITVLKGGFKRIPLEVGFKGDKKEGQVKIFYEHDGICYYDVYEFGCFEPQMSVTADEKEISVRVYNPTNEKLSLTINIASPFESWGSTVPFENRMGKVGMLGEYFELSAKEERIFTVPAAFSEDMLPSYWAAVKLGCNGRIYFAYDSRKGPRHNVWAHEFISEIIEDNGSIRKIIEM